MILQMKKLPITKDSKPFGSATKKCALVDAGYVEDEYLIYGTANIYETDEDEQAYVIYKDAPYVNRMILRRPVNQEKFSGRVIIEILNATAMIDLDRMWVNTWKYFVRNGDVYIGLTSKPDVFNALREFDPVRYQDITWENPMPERGIPEKFSFFPVIANQESGLIWDMIVDLAKLLRSAETMNPLCEYKNRKIYLTGWSQSAGYVVRIVKTFAYLVQNCSEGPLFDGYLQAGANNRITPINMYDYHRYPERKEGYFYVDGYSMMGAKEPYISVNTESENMQSNWGPDSDMPESLFREYEIPGASHDSKYNLVDYYADDKDLERIGRKPYYRASDAYPNDYPCEVIFHAAFAHLYRWSDGIVPPHAERINKDGHRRNVEDAFGNTTGGIRTAAINYPVCRYKHFSTLPNGRKHTLFGHSEPFSAEMLKELYGTLENYKKLVNKDTIEQIQKGFFLEEDAEEFVKCQVDLARKYGLE